MKAVESNLLKFLKKSPQFLIPIYQRNYSWTLVQCQQLWADVLRADNNPYSVAHFIGAVVYVERSLANVTHHEPLLVIDGQQRLTTCSLLIAALADYFETEKLAEILETFTAKKLRNNYLLNADEDGDRRYKLLLAEADKATLLALIDQAANPKPQTPSQRLIENHAFFKQMIASHSEQLTQICEGLAKLVIVDVALDRNQDNPQLIFESMNSTGLALSQADLIRNFILMGLEPKLQTQLYQTHWRPMEQAFGQTAYAKHFDVFMRHYLTAKTGDIPNINRVYQVFKKYAVESKTSITELVKDIHSYAGYYCAIALDQEQDKSLKAALKDLKELEVGVATPFLLTVYNDFAHQKIDAQTVVSTVRMVESYVFRRSVCAVPTNTLNKTFAVLAKDLHHVAYLESVAAALQKQRSGRRFPADVEFEKAIQTRDLYNFRNCRYYLRRLENFGRKEPVTTQDYTIEHILPQNKNMPQAWKIEVGEDWERIHATYLHTLGNLTLTAYNSQYSDHDFATKKSGIQDKEGHPIGFAQSPLKLNLGLGSVPIWNESEIKERAQRLATEALKVWRAPNLPAATMANYVSATKVEAGYTVADHPFLGTEPVASIYAAFKTGVLALDEGMSEVFLKLYVAFKEETNVVDVVSQSKRLLLILNMPFAELDDPRGACRDITGLGRWGNGDVEYALDNLADVPYALGLVRQSLNRQLGLNSDDQ